VTGLARGGGFGDRAACSEGRDGIGGRGEEGVTRRFMAPGEERRRLVGKGTNPPCRVTVCRSGNGLVANVTGTEAEEPVGGR